MCNNILELLFYHGELYDETSIYTHAHDVNIIMCHGDIKSGSPSQQYLNMGPSL